MQIPKDQIIQLLRSRGDDQKAGEADGQLPDTVDTDQHGGMLQNLGLDPQDLIGMLGGGGGAGGGLGQKLGL